MDKDHSAIRKLLIFTNRLRAIYIFITICRDKYYIDILSYSNT